MQLQSWSPTRMNHLYMANASILRRLPSVIHGLDRIIRDHNCPQAQGLLNALSNFKTPYKMHLLNVIGESLILLTKSFDRDELLIYEVYHFQRSVLLVRSATTISIYKSRWVPGSPICPTYHFSQSRFHCFCKSRRNFTHTTVPHLNVATVWDNHPLPCPLRLSVSLVSFYNYHVCTRTGVFRNRSFCMRSFAVDVQCF